MGGVGRGRVPERTFGADRLLDHLTSQIALCGSHGAGSSDFRHIVQQWFHEFQEPPSTAPIEEKTYERLWEWIRRRHDVRIYLRGERRDLSFAEFQAAEQIETGKAGALSVSQDQQLAPVQRVIPRHSNTVTATPSGSSAGLKNDKIRELLRARLAKEPHLMEGIDRSKPLPQVPSHPVEITSAGRPLDAGLPVPPTTSHGSDFKNPGNHSVMTTTPQQVSIATSNVQQDGLGDHSIQDSTSYVPNLEPSVPSDKKVKRGRRKVVAKGYVRNDDVSAEIFDTEVSTTTVPRLYASQNRTWQAVAGHSVDLQRLPGMLFVLLSIIASRGANGILQPDLVRISGQDKRSVPQRTDRLAKMGYIEKNPVQAAKMRTSLLVHKKLVRQGHFLKGPGGVEDVFRGDQIILSNFVPLLYNTLKDVNVIPVRSLRQRLNVSQENWPARTIRSTIVRLEESGLLKRVRARRKGSTEKWSTCIKLLREPNDADMKIMRFRRKQAQNEPPERVLEEDEDGDEAMRDMELEIESDGEMDVEEKKSEIQDIKRIPPQWTPERLVPNLIHEALSLAGPDGYDAAALRDVTMGKFWKRPIENVVVRMTDDWEKSQPPHLRHLALIRDTIITPEKRYIHYVYRTHGNFQKAADLGHVSWEAVSKEIQEDSTTEKANVRGNSQNITLDKWGFRVADPKDYHPNGTATLAECQALIKKNHRGARYWDTALAKSIGYEKPKKSKKERVAVEVEMPRTIVMTRAEAEAAAKFQHAKSLETGEPDRDSPTVSELPDTHDRQTISTNGSKQKEKRSTLITAAQREALGLPLKGRLGEGIEKQIRDHRRKTGDPTSLPDVLIKENKPRGAFKFGDRPLLTMEERAAMGLPVKGRLKKSIEDAIRKERGLLPDPAASQSEADNSGAEPRKKVERLTKEERAVRGMKPLGRPSKNLNGKRRAEQMASEAVPDEHSKEPEGAASEETPPDASKPPENRPTGEEHSLTQEKPKRKADTESHEDQRATKLPRLDSPSASGGVPQVSEQLEEGSHTSHIANSIAPKLKTGRTNKYPERQLRKLRVNRSVVGSFETENTSAKGQPSMQTSKGTTSRTLSFAISHGDQSGVYFDPLATWRGRGRPRKAYMAVFKLRGLKDLAWFESEPNNNTENKSTPAPIESGQTTDQIQNGNEDDIITSPVQGTEPSPRIEDPSPERAHDPIQTKEKQPSKQIAEESAVRNVKKVVDPRIEEAARIRFADLRRQMNKAAEQAIEGRVEHVPDEGPHDSAWQSQLASRATESAWTTVNASTHSEPIAHEIAGATTCMVTPQITPPARVQSPIADDSVAQSIEIDVSGLPSTAITAAMNASDLLDIERSTSAISEALPTSLPQAKKARGTTKQGVRLGQGSVWLLRKNIVFEIMKRCGGVFPYNGELYAPFESLWVQRLGNRMPVPDRTTQKATVDSLINNPEHDLKKMTFLARKLDGNESITRTILVQGDISPSSQQIQDLQQNIIKCWPKAFYPEEVHDLINLEPKVVPVSVVEKDLTIELEPTWRLRRARAKAIQEELDKRIMESVRERTGKFLQKAQNPEVTESAGIASVGSPEKQPGKGKKNEKKKRTRLTTARELPETAGESAEFAESFETSSPPHEVEEATRELPRTTGKSAQSFETSSPQHAVEESTCSFGPTGLRSPSPVLLDSSAEILPIALHPSNTPPINPETVYHPSNGTFSTELSALRENQSTHDASFEEATDVAISTLGKRARETGDEDSDDQNAQKKRRTSLGGSVALRNTSEAENTPSPISVKRVRKQKSKAKRNAVHSDPTLPERLVGLTGDPDEPIYVPPAIKNSMRKGEPEQPHADTEEATGGSPQEASVETPAGTSDQATQGELANEVQEKKPKARRSKKPKQRVYRYDAINNLKKLLCVFVIATNLSEDAGEIDWKIVTKIYRPEDGYELEQMKRHWSWAQSNQEEYLAALTERFQSCFLEAYEAGEIEALHDPNSYETYNWDALAQWAVQISPRYPKEALLEGDWATIHERYFVDASTRQVFNRQAWFNDKLSNRKRKKRVRKYLAVLPYHQHAQQTYSDEDVVLQARSMIRSNIATDQSAFDAHQAHEKFRTIAEPVLQGIVNDLMSRKLIQMIKLKRLRPGRNFHFKMASAKLFRSVFQLDDFMAAVEFKKSLDVAFSRDIMEERVVQPSRTAENGAVMALLTLLNSGQVRIVPRPPPIDNDPDSEEKRISSWGFVTAEYAQRKVDRQLLFWPIDIVPTSTYEFGNPLQPSPEPMVPLEEKEAPGSWMKLREPPLPGKADPTALLPIWSSINGQSVTWPWWNRILNMVVQIVQWRPGSNAASVYERCGKDTTELFEVELVLSWLVDVGAAELVNQEPEPTFRMTPLWWTVFGDELIGDEEDWFGKHVRRNKKKNILDPKIAKRFLPATEQNINLAWTEEEIQELRKDWSWLNVQPKPYSPEPESEAVPSTEQPDPQPAQAPRLSRRERARAKTQALREKLGIGHGRISKTPQKPFRLPRKGRTRSPEDEMEEESEFTANTVQSEGDIHNIAIQALQKTKAKTKKVDRRRRPPKDEVYYFGKEPLPEQPEADNGDDDRVFRDPYNSASASGARSGTDRDGDVQMGGIIDDEEDAEGEIDEEYLARTPTTPAPVLSTTPAPRVKLGAPAPMKSASRTPTPTDARTPTPGASLALDALRKAAQEGFQFNRGEKGVEVDEEHSDDEVL
ncbi:hypothetical protein P154DRAFT_527154 [Amniculicola lignicola CBS 123094]|uniref:Uncharacterized protein n=1 Tax=Amniculicola lignicola CBS 123094 TaxID=1392246 RepID=A0A6A5W0B9_9PLEO|nr:hypothetical protein P154DRAFT_527154 [Amniculicola lignicola CBS 123094]